MKVLVCGGRDYQNRENVYAVLDAIAAEFSLLSAPDSYGNTLPIGMMIIHGACLTGADRLADDYATTNWCPMKEFPADWKAHGRAAGPLRNQRMIDEGRPDLVVAFPGGRGTADMVRRAEAAGIPVRRIA